MNLLIFPPILRLRRNHALEHATIHLLTERGQAIRVVGRATFNGFYLYGDLETEQVRAAAQEALERLRRGERGLAVHPNCGTNLVTAGTMAGLAAVLAVGHRPRDRWERLPNALLAATAALVLARPLGTLLQARVTTMADPGSMVIRGVHRERRGNLVIHFVETGPA